MMWCGGFYEDNGNDEFPKGAKPAERYWEEEAERRFDIVRIGYNLLNHFQCD